MIGSLIVSSLMLQLHSQSLVLSKADTLLWNGDAKGKFKVRRCYQIIRNSSDSFPNCPWRVIWRNKAPLKVNCFFVAGDAWSMFNSGYSSEKKNYNLQQMYIVWEGESVNNLFLHCPYTSQIWHFLLSIVGGSVGWCLRRQSSYCNAGTWKDRKRQTKNMELNACCHLWCIWKERNPRIFQSKKESVISLEHRRISLLFIGCNMTIANDTEAMVDFWSSFHIL